MRVIKFRGKSLENGKWSKGALMPYKPTATSETKPYIGDCVFKGFPCEAHPVDPATIGQFTSLYDKNGVEIYEGDILSINTLSPNFYNYTAVVEWRVDGYDGRTLDNDYVPILVEQYDIAIIGNIHETPELLKTEKQ